MKKIKFFDSLCHTAGTKMIKQLKLIAVFIFLTVWANCQAQNTNRMKIIYVYDALCGWCYGFSPTMQEFHNKYQSELDFEVISGGMVTKDRIGPIGEVASYISWAYKEVERTTGVQFGTSFLQGVLKDGKAIFYFLSTHYCIICFQNAFSRAKCCLCKSLTKGYLL
ncbi:MAG: hypothetical protein HC892_10655 [Saprospiraceae bacterium]|nr:hypothetical protein [Saprospiraceae bacterium]